MLDDALAEGLGDAKGQFDFLGSDEATLEQTEKEMQSKLSFNIEIPKDPKEFEELMKRLEKEHPAAEGEKPPGFESGDDETDAEEAKIHDEGSASGEAELAPEEKSEYRDLLSKVLNKRTELDNDDSAEAESIRREILKLEQDMDEEMDENPDFTERTKEQKTQYEKWKKALKDRDIWGGDK